MEKAKFISLLTFSVLGHTVIWFLIEYLNLYGTKREIISTDACISGFLWIIPFESTVTALEDRYEHLKTPDTNEFPAGQNHQT